MKHVDREFKSELTRHLRAALRVYQQSLTTYKLPKRKRFEVFMNCLDAADREFRKAWASKTAGIQQEIAQLKRSKQNQAERQLEVAYQAIQQIPIWNRILKTPEAVGEFALAVMEVANGVLPRIHIDRIPGFVKWLQDRVKAKQHGVVYFHCPFNGRAFDFYGFPHQMPTRERQHYLDAGRQKGLDLLGGKTVPRAKKRGLEKTAQRNRFMRERFLELRRNGVASKECFRVVRAEVKKRFGRSLSIDTIRRRCMDAKVLV